MEQLGGDKLRHIEILEQVGDTDLPQNVRAELDRARDSAARRFNGKLQQVEEKFGEEFQERVRDRALDRIENAKDSNEEEKKDRVQNILQKVEQEDVARKRVIERQKANQNAQLEQRRDQLQQQAPARIQDRAPTPEATPSRPAVQERRQDALQQKQQHTADAVTDGPKPDQVLPQKPKNVPGAVKKQINKTNTNNL